MQINIKVAEISQNKELKNSKKFHIKIRKPHLKLRKVLFKRGLVRNVKKKKFLEFEVEKEIWEYFLENKILLNKDNPFRVLEV